MEKITVEYRGMVQECKNPEVKAMALEQRANNLSGPVLFTQSTEAIKPMANSATR